MAIARIPAGSTSELIEALAFAASADGSDRSSHVARLELTLESARRPELQIALRDSGRAVHEALTERLVSLGVAGASKKSTALLAIMDGLLLDALSGPDARVRSLEEARSLLRLALP